MPVAKVELRPYSNDVYRGHIGGKLMHQREQAVALISNILDGLVTASG